MDNALIAREITGALVRAAAAPSNSLQPSEVNGVAGQVIAAVAPIVAHATNTEPWYQSRVVWGAIVSALVPILGAIGVATDWIDPNTAVNTGIALGSVIGGVLTLYGRLRAKKPIGA